MAAIVGPTAVGKTAVSLEVAEALDAEIVSVDSMQIYRGMDIGTAKPDAAMQQRVPHHLLDIKDPAEPVTVSDYQELARAAIADIFGRGRLPLLVGGSGLYLRAVVDDLEFPPRSAEVRSALEEEAESLGAEALHARLAELDPAAAAKIEPGNARRTVRALEVIELTGRPFSDNDAWERYESRYHLAMVGLRRDRDDLYDRVAARVDEMFEQGFAAEVAALSGRPLGPTARQALGYKQILDNPAAPAGETKAEIVKATKRFVRRQDSWFRSDPRIEWLDATGAGLTGALTAFFREALGLP
ncbi:MAG: tRNA (adenosine(37)-N6)-dimethylallyltransferase MiaA [Actinomycetota bacterium]